MTTIKSLKRVSRKELATYISEQRGHDVSVDALRRNEVAWGLTESRGKDLNKRTIRYNFELAVAALSKVGVI